jgi:hypothetical protein
MNVGDLVVCVDTKGDDWCITKGKIYMVNRREKAVSRTGYYYIEVEGDDGMFHLHYPESFKLAPSKELI